MPKKIIMYPGINSTIKHRCSLTAHWRFALLYILYAVGQQIPKIQSCYYL